jgi:hypothetical protein
VFFVALIPAALIGWRFSRNELGANPIRELEIQTGLWTLRFLAITLSITPVRRTFGWNWIAKYRRMLGLFTFFYATVHLSMWAFVDWFFAWGDMWQEILKHKYILIGMLTWLIMVPLAITSTKGWVRRLGKRRHHGHHSLPLGGEEGHLLPRRVPRGVRAAPRVSRYFRAAETIPCTACRIRRISGGIVPSSKRMVFARLAVVTRTVYENMSAPPCVGP